MVSYKSCKARPPFTIGLSFQDVCKKFGIEPKKTVEAVKVEAPKVQEPLVEETKPEKEVVVEPEAIPETIVETVVDAPVPEPVKEEVATVTPLTVLDIQPKYAKQLEANGINSVEDLIAFEGDLEELPKIGRAAKQAVMEALNKWQNEQKQTLSTEAI